MIISLISEVLKTPTVQVKLQQKRNGAACIVIGVVDAKALDAMVEALKRVSQE